MAQVATRQTFREKRRVAKGFRPAAVKHRNVFVLHEGNPVCEPREERWRHALPWRVVVAVDRHVAFARKNVRREAVTHPRVPLPRADPRRAPRCIPRGEARPFIANRVTTNEPRASVSSGLDGKPNARGLPETLAGDYPFQKRKVSRSASSGLVVD